MYFVTFFRAIFEVGTSLAYAPRECIWLFTNWYGRRLVRLSRRERAGRSPLPHDRSYRGGTTVSAFSLFVALLWERGEVLSAALYIVGSVVLSVACVFLGLALMRTQ